MPAPETVQLGADTAVAPGAVIEPYVVFGPGVRVEAGAVIHSFCHLERAIVAAGASDRPVRAAAARHAAWAQGAGRHDKHGQPCKQVRTPAPRGL